MVKQVFDETLNFKMTPTSFSINAKTVSTTCVEIIVGFVSGELLFHNPLSNKQNNGPREIRHYNRHSALVKAPVQRVLWLPQSANLFLVAFGVPRSTAQNTNDTQTTPQPWIGTLWLFDSTKEDDPHFVFPDFNNVHNVGETVIQIPLPTGGTTRYTCPQVWRNSSQSNPRAIWNISTQPILGTPHSISFPSSRISHLNSVVLPFPT